MSHAHRRPHHISHAIQAGGEVNHTAVAAEMRHVADLIDAGQIKLRNVTEAPLGDGWDRMQFDRKVDPALSTEGAVKAPMDQRAEKHPG